MAAKTASLSVNIIADAAKAKAGLKEAETAFGKFSREVGNAQGAMGKFKVIGGAAFDSIKANAIGFASGAAAAIGAFAIKSVMAFQDLALEAGKFADATGLSSEQASRFIEVAGDIGVEASQVEKSIGFMNKTLGNSPQLFKDLGVEIEYTAGGATDINATFLNVIDRLNKIQDPAARAAAGTKLLGRSWMELSELVAVGSDGLAKSLAQVSDAKVIDEDEVRKARDFRASMDELKDRFEDLTLELGENLVPAITQAIDQFLVLSDAIGKVPVLPDILGNMFKGRPFHMAFTEALVDMVSEIFNLGEESAKTYEVTDQLTVAWKDGYRAMIDAVPPAQNLTSEIERQQQALEDAKYAWDLFKGNLSMELERQKIVSDIEEFRKKWAGSTDEAKRKSEEYRNELLRLQIGVANFGGEAIRTATIATQNRIRVLVETGQLERAVSLLQYIRNNTLGYVDTPKYGSYAVTPYGAAVARADGGVVRRPELTLMGEAGPEVVIPLTKPARAEELMQQTGLSQLPMRQSGSMTVNVSVQAGLVSSPDQVGAQIIDAIRRAERRSGQVFASA